MSGDARRSFLTGLESLRESLNSPLVSSNDPVGSFLRRGLTIVSYNLLEAFVEERIDEIAAYVNGGIVHFGDLPERLQRAATFDVIQAANSRVRRGGWELAAAIAFATRVGNCLAASSGQLKLSALTWQWAGSNMTADDVYRALRLFHVAKPWATIESLSERAGAAMADPKTILVGLLRERNFCAHESTYSVSNLWIRAVPHQLMTIGMSVDIAISVAAHELHEGRTEFLGDQDWVSPNRISFRFIEERSKDWAEIIEGSSKAAHVSKDKSLLLGNAVRSARGKRQVVIVRNRTSQLLDWIYPELP